MAKKAKRKIRESFYDACVERDGYKCMRCNKPWEQVSALDVHHIISRNNLPNGGYVKENGITLCRDCHQDAEAGIVSPEVLFGMIDSNQGKAFVASVRLIFSK